MGEMRKRIEQLIREMSPIAGGSPLFGDYNIWGQVVIEPGPSGAQYVRIDNNGHIGAGGTAPTAAAGGGSGTTPPAPAVVSGSSDCRGSVTFGTGTTPVNSAGSLVAVTFNVPFITAPIVNVTPTTGGLAALNIYVTANTTSFSIFANTTATASLSGTTGYSANWVVFQ